MEEFKFTFDADKFKKKNKIDFEQNEETAETDFAETYSDTDNESASFKDGAYENTSENCEDSEKKDLPAMNEIPLGEDKYDISFEDESETEIAGQNETGESNEPEEQTGQEEQTEQQEQNGRQDKESRMRLKAEKRLAARREAAEKKALRAEQKKHRGNYILFYIAFGLIFIILAASLSLTVFFNISKIEVSGSQIYSAEEIIFASGLKNGDNMFLTSFDKSREQIISSLPYVRDVSFKKRINGKITVNVVETFDYMVVSCKEGFAILSPEKKILRTTSGCYPSNLVHVFGLSVSDSAPGKQAEFESSTAERITDLLIPELIKAGFNRVSDLDVSDSSSVKVVYDERIQLNLGTAENFEYKLNFAKEAISSAIGENETGILDLSQLSETNREIHFRKAGFYNVTA